MFAARQGFFSQPGGIDRPVWNIVAPSTNGLPTVSSAQVKWGTTSAFWDGTAKGLAFTTTGILATASVASGGLIPIGTGMPFTVEMWIYIPSANLGTQRTFFDAGRLGVAIGMQSSNRLFMGHSGITFGLVTSTTLPGNAWNHLAFMVTSSNNNVIFLNGVATSGGTYNYSFTNPWGGVIQPAVGIDGFGTRFIGYMQDIRVSNGAIYPTTGFTPPTAPLVNTAQTRLLIPCYNGTIADDNTIV